MKVGSRSKWSPRFSALVSVLVSGVGGMTIEEGIQQFLHAKSRYNWAGSFLSGAAFLLMGMFLAEMWVRSTPSSEAKNEKDRPQSSLQARS